VSGVAALPRIVTLHDVEITSDPKNSSGDLQLDITAKTYRYLDDEEQAAAQPQSPSNRPGNRPPAGG
jgi:type IV pilus assembly protein PilO